MSDAIPTHDESCARSSGAAVGTGDSRAQGRASSTLARVIIAKHSKSFALASRLLPTAVRDDAVVLYAYCRRVDDAIDGVEPGQQPAALDRLRRELDDIYAGRPPREPILEAFQALVVARGIPRLYPEELLAGMEMDVQGARYATREELLYYCYRVAAVVGLMMCHVMGVRRDGALVHAAHLGIAMQLTNIARDVLEDWERGRLYLPEDLLARHGAADLDPRRSGAFPASAAPVVARATLSLLELADDYYRSGDAGMRDLAPRSALGVCAARLIYSRIGVVLRARAGDPLSGRAVVTTRQKLGLVLRAGVTTLLRLFRSLGRGRVRGPERVLSLREAIELGGAR